MMEEDMMKMRIRKVGKRDKDMGHDIPAESGLKEMLWWVGGGKARRKENCCCLHASKQQ
jgi:hypothetical protein